MASAIGKHPANGLQSPYRKPRGGQIANAARTAYEIKRLASLSQEVFVAGARSHGNPIVLG